ncbi:MAG: Serine/threonine exchanger SteT [Flavobacterium sp. SCGC AAA160-P02]|nr:MAG: Serine/threonine exchanger SteT [Flavobacterium sp. SCGC AAA160-P02]
MKLQREVNTLGLSANIINIIIGGGIFVLPATIAASLGSASIIAYLFCGFVMLLVMGCFAELGSVFTGAGGSYNYIESSFGTYPGFITALLIVLASFSGDAAVVNAIADILGTFVPVFKEFWMRSLFFIFLFFGFGYINIIGLKKGVGFVKLVTLLKLIPLFLVILFGFKEIHPSSLQWDTMPSINDIGEMSLILFFAFIGAEKGLSLSGEVKNPQKTIPKAIALSIAAILIIYILIQLISQGVLGDTLSKYDKNPLAEVANLMFGPIGFTIMTFGAAISMIGSLSSKILSMPRVIFAASKNNVIPIKKLAEVHKKFATPYISIILYTGLGFLFAIIGGFKELAIISSASTLLIYLGISLATLKLKISKSKDISGGFKVPGGFIVPVISSAIIIWLLSKLSQDKIWMFLGVLLFLSIVFLLLRFFQKKSLNVK